MITRSLPALAAAATLAFAPLAHGANYNLDPTHTNVFFEALHFGTSTNRGTWTRKSGTVQFDRAARTGKVELQLDMSSVWTGIPPFDKMLQGEAFFDVANHPTATFASDRFVFNGDKVSEVQGQLTLRGKTLPVTLKAVRFGCYQHPMLKREVCGGDFEATIQRTQWGVSWGVPPGGNDDTRLLIQVEAIKAD